MAVFSWLFLGLVELVRAAGPGTVSSLYGLHYSIAVKIRRVRAKHRGHRGRAEDAKEAEKEAAPRRRAGWKPALQKRAVHGRRRLVLASGGGV